MRSRQLHAPSENAGQPTQWVQHRGGLPAMGGRRGTPPPRRYLCLFMCQEDGKQADPPSTLALTLYTVPEAAKDITEPQPASASQAGKLWNSWNTALGDAAPKGGGPPQAGQARPCRQEQQLGTHLPWGIWKGRLPLQGEVALAQQEPSGLPLGVGGDIRDKFPRQKSLSFPHTLWPQSCFKYPQSHW